MWEQIIKCHDGNAADSLACCKNHGVPFTCAGNCMPIGGECKKWYDEVEICADKGKECCDKQGIPDECSAYC